MAFRGEDNRQNIVLETTVNYDRKFKKHHHINAVLGYTHEDRQRKTLAIQVGDFAGNDLLYYAIGEGTNTMDKSSSCLLYTSESTDLKEWKTANGDTLQLILRKGDSAYGERGFWAPQLFKEGNRYYLTYTANEHTALASSNSVYGPFRQDSIRPIDETAKNIDSFLFKDSDGKYYLYHVRFNKGNYLWVA